MTATKRPTGSSILEEMKEFGTFPKATQRYIRRSLDVGLGRSNTVRRWARDTDEATAIRDQALAYRGIDALRAMLAEADDLVPAPELMAALIAMTAHDLAQARLGFVAYRFLYERLLGAAARPWLTSAFCAASALPSLHPDLRRSLLRTMEEAAATANGWSSREPVFMPEWVDKVDLAVA